MSKFFKIFGITIGIIILVLILSGILIIKVFNLDSLKPIIAKKVYEQTGRQVTWKGDVHWTVFPVLGFDLNKIQLSNVKGFGDQTFASADKIVISVKLLPLLFHRQIQSSNLTIKGLKVNLVKDKTGVVNWKMKAAKQIDTIKAKPQAQATPAKKEKSGPQFNVKIKKINLDNATVAWNNIQNNQHITIKNINLTATNIQNKTAFPVKASIEIHSKKPDINGKINLNTQVQLLPNKYQFNNFVLTTALRGKSLPTGKLNTQLNSNFTVTPNSFNTQSLTATINKMIHAKAAVQFSNNILHISPINATLYNGTFAGAGKINLQKTPTINFKGNLNNINMQPFAQDFLDYNNLLGRGNLQFSLNMIQKSQQTPLQGLNGRLRFSIKNGAIKNIDLNHYYKTASALFNKKAPPQRKGPNQTNFGSLTGTATIIRGVVSNNDLLLTASSFRAKGKGTVNLVTQRLNYRFETNSIGAGKLDEFTAPIIVSGNLSNPSVKLDVENVLKKGIQQKLDKALDLFKIQF